MKKIRFTNRKENTVKEEMMTFKIGESVFSLVQNVKETNEAIRWCNTHKTGDVLERDDYKIEITEG